jgi:hypothetical protein
MPVNNCIFAEMKKLFLFCFSLLFIAASSGASISIHYCRGKVSAVSLSLLSDPGCACGKKKPKKSCCKTETKLVKMQDDTRQPEFVNDHSFTQVVALPLQDIHVTIPVESNSNSPSFSVADPPDAALVPLYLRHRVFRL